MGETTRWYALCGLILIVLFLAACEKVTLVDDVRPVLPPRNSADGRPEIPRTNQPEDTPDDYVEPVPPRINRTTVFVPSGTPGTDLDVPLGDTIGEHHKLITQKEFLLLRHQPVRVSSNELVGYEELIRFDFGANSTGKVIFGQDDDEIGTFLKFERDRPILEYRLQLKQGTFEHYSGREIQVLGHTYVIAEASNRSISLYGVSVASNLFLDNDSDLTVNSTSQSDTVVRVTPSWFSFTIYADGKDENKSILLSPNESLGENVGRLIFGTDLMDIRYKGAPQLEGATIKLLQDDEGYSLIAQTAAGDLDLDLATLSGDRIVLGDGESGLRIMQCGYCIAPGDRFLVTTSDGRTYVLRYSALAGDKLVIRDVQDTRHYFEVRGNLSRDATADIIIGGYRFPAWIGQPDNVTGERNISVEQGFRSRRVEIVLANGAILRIGTPNGTALPLQVIVPAAKTIERREQRLDMNITHNGAWHVVVGNVTFVEDERTDDTFGITSYGTLIHLEREDEDLPFNIGDDATIIVPVEPLYGVVAIED